MNSPTTDSRPAVATPANTPIVIGTSTRCKPMRPDNTGNILHAVAARRILKRYRDFPTLRSWTEREVETVQQHSHIVLVTANAVRVNSENPTISANHKIIADNILRTDLPVVILGLGAQAPLSRPQEFTIPAETLRLLKIVSERARSIAVRGEFTAEVLNHFGIKNAEVIGCQSVFWHRQSSFPFSLTRPSGTFFPIAFNYTNARPEARLVQFAVAKRFDMIGQQQAFEEHAQHEMPFEGPTKVGHLFAAGLTDESYRAYCKRHFHQFYEADTWIEHMRQYSFSFGTRFHGNVAALLAGVPALWLLHDSRTEELCRTFCFPTLRLSDALKGISLERYIAAADFSRFYRRYEEVYDIFKAYLANSKIEHTLM